MFTQLWTTICGFLSSPASPYSLLEQYIKDSNPSDGAHIEKLITDFHSREGSKSWL